jgi:hypothetical protein
MAGFKESKGATLSSFSQVVENSFVDKRVVGIDWTLVRE